MKAFKMLLLWIFCNSVLLALEATLKKIFAKKVVITRLHLKQHCEAKKKQNLYYRKHLKGFNVKLSGYIFFLGASIDIFFKFEFFIGHCHCQFVYVWTIFPQ